MMLAVSSLHEFDHHETPARHPERPARLTAAWHGLLAANLGDALTMIEPRAATPDELTAVHTFAHVEGVERFCANGGGRIDPDTSASTGTWDTALRAAGAGLALVDAIDRGQATSGLALIRPPGHHALPDRSMGFCIFNNVAVTARALTSRGERVLVVDWDVHHGNGTQEIFWNDPNVLFVSSQLAPHWPFSGEVHETGGPQARGLTINLPLPAGATGDVLMYAYEQVVAEAAAAFQPTWVLISAGFDSHRDDPLGGLGLAAGDYKHLAKRLQEFAPGRVVMFLEGGYNLDATALSVGAAAAGLLDAAHGPVQSPADTDEAPTAGGPGRDIVNDALREHRSAIAK